MKTETVLKGPQPGWMRFYPFAYFSHSFKPWPRNYQVNLCLSRALERGCSSVGEQRFCLLKVLCTIEAMQQNNNNPNVKSWQATASQRRQYSGREIKPLISCKALPYVVSNLLLGASPAWQTEFVWRVLLQQGHFHIVFKDRTFKVEPVVVWQGLLSLASDVHRRTIGIQFRLQQERSHSPR